MYGTSVAICKNITVQKWNNLFKRHCQSCKQKSLWVQGLGEYSELGFLKVCHVDDFFWMNEQRRGHPRANFAITCSS